MEQSERRAAAEIAYASLVVKIDDRDALPVRAIPYVTGWSIPPDEVAKQFARKAQGGFEKLRQTHSYHQQGGRVVALLPKEWDAYVAAVEALEAELKGKFHNDDEGYAAWVSSSVAKLPAGVFVWLDDFTADWRRDFGPERLSIIGERPGDRELNLSPYLENESLNMVLEGFSPREPFLTHGGDDVIAGWKEVVLNGRLIDWEYWVKNMPTLSPAEASRLMAGLDPELFEDLAARPVPKNDPSRACVEAKRMERLALAQGRGRCLPTEWLAWARDSDFSVHRGFFLAVRGRYLRENEAQVLAEMPRIEARVWERAVGLADGLRQVSTEYAAHLSTVTTSFPDFVAEVEERLARWRRGRYELIEAAEVLARSNGFDARQLAAQMDDAIHTGKLVYRLNNIPVDVQRVPRGHLWHRIVLQDDVNAWLTAIGAGYLLEYPYDDGDGGFVPLEKRLGAYFGLSLAQLPHHIAAVVRAEYDLIPWEDINPAQRLDLARQKDMQADPALEPMRRFYWDQAVLADELQREIETVKSKKAVEFGDYERQQQTLRGLEERLRHAQEARPLTFGAEVLLLLLDGSWENLPGGLEHCTDGIRALPGGLQTSGFLRSGHDGNFSAPVLPFPFSADDFFEFCKGAPVFADDWLDSRFLNDDGTRDLERIALLSQASPAAAQLVLRYLEALKQIEALAGKKVPEGPLFGVGVAPRVKVHKLATKAHALSAVIERARQLATNPDDYLSVWAALARMAQSPDRPAPIVGYVDAEGVQYQTAEREELKYFTKRALKARFSRAKAR